MAQILQMADPISSGSGLQESGRQICRFCLESSEDYLNLLEKCGEEIATFLQQYHSITIDHSDAWPKSACLSCVGRITSFRTLCDTIRRSEQTLKEIYGDSDVKNIKKEEEEEEEVFPESFSESLTQDFPENFPQIFPDSIPASSSVSIPKPTIKTELPDDPDFLTIENFFPMTCDFCKMEFSKYIELHLHMRHEHQKRRWYIRCCEVKHWQKRGKLEHIMYHTNPDKFKCQHCQRQFMNEKALSNHIQNRHKPEKRVLECDLCHKTFAMKYILRNHIEQTHLKFPVDRKRACFCVCETCGKVFHRKDYLKLHMKIHSRFIGPDGTPQPPHKPFKCDKCDSAFKTRWLLNNHKKKHDAYGQYRCKECGKISPNPAALSKHIKNAHTLTRAFVCDICNKGFKRDYVLKEHIATHTGAYLYTCDYCPKEFRAGATKSLHIRREHPEMRKKR